MSFDSLIQWVTENLITAIIVGAVVIFILFRLFRTARMYLGMKSYVKKAKKQDRKKFNGLVLVDKISKKRKKETNAFNKLRGGAKKKVRKYLTHKFDELPVFTKYSHGKLLKRSKEKLIIIIKNERKTLRKIRMKKSIKQVIDVTNKYQCLDEMITFLHNLPDAILDQQEYDIYAGDEDILITYAIK